MNLSPCNQMIKEKISTAVVWTEHEKIISILYWCSYKLPSNACEGRSDKVSYNLNLTIAAGAFRCCPYVFKTVDMLKRYNDAKTSNNRQDRTDSNYQSKCLWKVTCTTNHHNISSSSTIYVHIKIYHSLSYKEYRFSVFKYKMLSRIFRSEKWLIYTVRCNIIQSMKLI